MSSFHFDVGGKSRSNRLAGRIRRALLRALQEEKEENGLTQQKLAEKLGVHRSVVNRQLTGEANFTLKSLSELLWALNRDFQFEVKKFDSDKTANVSSPLSSGTPTVIGKETSPSSTNIHEIELKNPREHQHARIRMYEATV